MEKLFQKIDDIPNIADLVFRINKSLYSHKINRTVTIQSPEYNFYEIIDEFIKANPHPVWNGLSLKSGLIFVLGKDKAQGLHIDGFRADRSGASNYALNIPIRNTGIGSMDWYGGAPYRLEVQQIADATVMGRKTNSNKYLKLEWEGEPKLIESVTIKDPHLVRIDVPHQAINLCKEKPRYMLSIRFTPDLKWL
ncbi:hypothetical protein N9V27_01465 [bacterium]|nr:hypothetical protein [bacterium]